jgi:omega-6 fatty acid desaturase (delta-12 desaturase)
MSNTKHETQPIARDWVLTLSKYRDPSNWRSSFELAVTVLPFLALWALACYVLQFSYLGAFAISALNGAFLLRLFIIQHDCGHASFLANRTLSDWIGRALGVLTLTPYDVWKRTHALHHGHTGDLGHRGIGDVMTLTVDEFNALSPWKRVKYRAYRHPLTMFVLGPSYLFLLQNRLPFGLMKSGSKYWISSMGTNLATAAALLLIWWFVGLGAVFLVFLPTTLVAASIGVWLFYVQHQFETTHWDDHGDWDLHEAALHGSSHYDLPKVLRWFTGNIGIHHVHHLYSRIPFYRLPEVLRDHTELVEQSRLTIWQSFKCASLDLWDEKSRRLVSFRTASRLKRAIASD